MLTQTKRKWLKTRAQGLIHEKRSVATQTGKMGTQGMATVHNVLSKNAIRIFEEEFARQANAHYGCTRRNYR
jgi:hypothetical protein